VTVAGQPVEHRLRGGPGPPVVGRHGQLDERDEPPVRAAPLLVWMHAEPSVRPLPAQEPAYDRPGEEPTRGRGAAFSGEQEPELVPSPVRR
jgi:hypothetical protein